MQPIIAGLKCPLVENSMQTDRDGNAIYLFPAHMSEAASHKFSFFRRCGMGDFPHSMGIEGSDQVCQPNDGDLAAGETSLLKWLS